MSFRVARGGKAVYGAAIGILMLEARFPRIPGDIGNRLVSGRSRAALVEHALKMRLQGLGIVR